MAPSIGQAVGSRAFGVQVHRGLSAAGWVNLLCSKRHLRTAGAGLAGVVCTPCVDGLSSAKQWTPSPVTAGVHVELHPLAPCHRALWPSPGPSMGGAVFHVIVGSSQVQFVIAWMLPPETLPAFVTFATWSWR